MSELQVLGYGCSERGVYIDRELGRLSIDIV